MAKKKQTATSAATEAAPAAAATAPVVVQISESRMAELRAMLGPDGKLTASAEEDMRERGIAAEEVLEAIKTGTSHRPI